LKNRIILLLFVVIISGCSSGKTQTGLFVYRKDDLFMTSLVTGIIKRAEKTGLSLETYYGLNSQIIQNEQIENFIEENPSLLILNLVDRTSAYAVIKKLKAAEVPVIFFNREPLESDLSIWGKTWYVGAKAEQSAKMQAQLVMELFGPDPGYLNKYDRNGDGKIQTVILKGEQGHQDAEIRTATVLKTFNSSGYKIDVLDIQSADWNRNEAYEKMKGILKHIAITPELVISNNDAMALGAIALMRQRGFFKDSNGNGIIDKNDESWIPVVGIDGVPEAVKQIREGYLYGTVINDWKEMAKAITELAEVIISGKSIDDFSYNIENGKYIWIDYKPFKLD